MKVCSKSILAQKCDFGPLELSLDPQQEHDLRNGVPEVWDCKTSTFPIGSLMNIYGNFIEIDKKLFKSVGRGGKTEMMLAGKCEKGFQKYQESLYTS